MGGNMKQLRIAIQGIRGSNHHQVAMDYFGADVELVECLSFHELVDVPRRGGVERQRPGHGIITYVITNIRFVSP